MRPRQRNYECKESLMLETTDGAPFETAVVHIVGHTSSIFETAVVHIVGHAISRFEIAVVHIVGTHAARTCIYDVFAGFFVVGLTSSNIAGLYIAAFSWQWCKGQPKSCPPPPSHPMCDNSICILGCWEKVWSNARGTGRLDGQPCMRGQARA